MWGYESLSPTPRTVASPPLLVESSRQTFLLLVSLLSVLFHAVNLRPTRRTNCHMTLFRAPRPTLSNPLLQLAPLVLHTRKRDRLAPYAMMVCQLTDGLLFNHRHRQPHLPFLRPITTQFRNRPHRLARSALLLDLQYHQSLLHASIGHLSHFCLCLLHLTVEQEEEEAPRGTNSRHRASPFHRNPMSTCPNKLLYHSLALKRLSFETL